MRLLEDIELHSIHGGKELTNAEATNAYMMAGSMFFPIIGIGMFKAAFPLVAETSLPGVLGNAVLTAAGTGIGVWIGYQIYYAIYDD